MLLELDPSRPSRGIAGLPWASRLFVDCDWLRRFLRSSPGNGLTPGRASDAASRHARGLAPSRRPGTPRQKPGLGPTRPQVKSAGSASANRSPRLGKKPTAGWLCPEKAREGSRGARGHDTPRDGSPRRSPSPQGLHRSKRLKTMEGAKPRGTAP